MTATASNPTFTEGAADTQGAAVTVFGAAFADTIDAGQTIKGLTFTVSGLLDGANEKAVVDGTSFSLTDGTTGTTSGNGLGYSVSVVAGVATVTLTSASGLSTSAAQSVVNGIAYQDTNVGDPTAGTRTFTLTQVVDSGSNTSPNADTTPLSLASDVTVTAVNNAPVATITPASYSARTQQTSLNLKRPAVGQRRRRRLRLDEGDAGGDRGHAEVTAGTSGAVVRQRHSSVTITGTVAQVNALLNTQRRHHGQLHRQHRHAVGEHDADADGERQRQQRHRRAVVRHDTRPSTSRR